MSQTNVLITGASRGLGRALVERFLAFPNHTVIALNRDPEGATSKALFALPRGSNTTLIVTKYDAADGQSPFDAVKELQDKHGITHLDIVVANAGIVKIFPYARDVKREDILEHIQVNVLGVVSIFQATREAENRRQPDIPSSAYGASKSMVYWYGIRINAEEEWLNTFVFDPAWAQTDMGNESARNFGLEKATHSVDEVTDGLVQVLRTTSKEKHGGKAVLYTGEVLEW